MRLLSGGPRGRHGHRPFQGFAVVLQGYQHSSPCLIFAQHGIWQWVCAWPAPVVLMDRGCAMILSFSFFSLTTGISYSTWLSSLLVFLLFFLCSRLRVRCKVTVSKDTKIWCDTGRFRRVSQVNRSWCSPCAAWLVHKAFNSTLEKTWQTTL